MRAIPMPVRQRIIQLYQRGESTRDLAGFLGFCVAAVRRVRQQFKQRGTLQPRTSPCGRKPLLTAGRKARLRQLVAAQPDATLAELGARLDRRFGTSTIDLWLHKRDLAIMDNLATHKMAGVGPALESVGAHLLYLPPYSPDFNPIENVWSKIKQILCSAAPRSEDQPLEAARAGFNAISTADCRSFSLQARYAA